MIGWLNTIRWKNLLIIWVCILVIIIPHFNLARWFHFIEFIYWGIISTAVAAVGNITNDLLDVKQDKENKKPNIFKDKKNKPFAYFIISLLLIMAISACMISKYFSFFFLMTCVSLFLLVLYNIFLKRMPLIGNIVIATLTALIFLGIDYIVMSRLIYYQYGFQNKQIELLMGFAFLSTLIREIIKDAEDRKGDLFARFYTIAKFLNDQWIGILVLSISLLGSFGVYFLISNRSTHFFSSFLIYAIALNLISISATIVMFIPNPSKYVRATRIVKAGMIGCLGIYLYLSL